MSAGQARCGSDEFSFCLEGWSLAAVRGFAQRMHGVASEVRAPGKSVSISMGIGLHFDGVERTLTQPLNEAEDTIYAAKRQGPTGRIFLMATV
ncbi:GGDEF domain-containing protein [Roseobacter ponti]|uniref:GGDEF domain-containing protein n=1 Tax=Roseobacter ponti TaxID=1891787 RepID=A0A858SRP0_9RHOB|nr:GGDEF domain-containing protein [Roseobacter ponti]QJF50343.1 GGDEF domain-containing protein [Roseobacter ponti]